MKSVRRRKPTSGLKRAAGRQALDLHAQPVGVVVEPAAIAPAVAVAPGVCVSA